MNKDLLTKTQLACMTSVTKGGEVDLTRHSGPGTANTRKWVRPEVWQRRQPPTPKQER